MDRKYPFLIQILKEEFEDTKGVIRIRKSRNRKHNGQKIKYKRTNNDLQNIHIKLKIELHEPTKNRPGWTHVLRKWKFSVVYGNGIIGGKITP